MADKPTTLPEWASTEETDPVSGQLNRVEPPAERKESGWTRREIPPRQWWNWLLWRNWQWLSWVDAGTATNTATTLMERDGNGRSKVNGPSANKDIVNKEWADGRYLQKPSATGNEDIKWLSKGIGEYYVVDDSLTGVDVPPTDNAAFRFVKLTAGEAGSGQYNEGVLTSESVSGSDPEITATAVIDYPDSPIDGQTIRLYNTERRFLRAGNAGATEDSQFGAHDHGGGDHGHDVELANQGGDEPHSGSGYGSFGAGNPSSGTADDPDAVKNTNNIIASEGGDETRPRNIGVTYYMRIA